MSTTRDHHADVLDILHEHDRPQSADGLVGVCTGDADPSDLNLMQWLVPMAATDGEIVLRLDSDGASVPELWVAWVDDRAIGFTADGEIVRSPTVHVSDRLEHCPETITPVPLDDSPFQEVDHDQ